MTTPLEQDLLNYLSRPERTGDVGRVIRDLTEMGFFRALGSQKEILAQYINDSEWMCEAGKERARLHFGLKVPVKMPKVGDVIEIPDQATRRAYAELLPRGTYLQDITAGENEQSPFVPLLDPVGKPQNHIGGPAYDGASPKRYRVLYLPNNSVPDDPASLKVGDEIPWDLIPSLPSWIEFGWNNDPRVFRIISFDGDSLRYEWKTDDSWNPGWVTLAAWLGTKSEDRLYVRAINEEAP